MELFTPAFGLVFWMFVVFVLLCVLLGKFAWPAIIKMMTDRADLIDKGVAYAEEAKEAATVEANKVMEAAKVSIEQERKEAELQFRNEVSTFAIQIAEKLLREHMADEKAQSQLVDKLLDEIETKN